jgi:hypothetical protein
MYLAGAAVRGVGVWLAGLRAPGWSGHQNLQRLHPFFHEMYLAGAAVRGVGVWLAGLRAPGWSGHQYLQRLRGP